MAGVESSNLTAQRDFTALRAEVDKVDISKLANVLTSLCNLKAKINGLDAGKLKPVAINRKKN